MSVQVLRERIVAAKQGSAAATLREYVKLSGQGWLPSAITLGGGSLAGSLYLGTIGALLLLVLAIHFLPRRI